MARSGGMERDKDNLSGGVRADLIEEICKRLEPYLPIKSLEDLSKKVDEIQVGSHDSLEADRSSRGKGCLPGKGCQGPEGEGDRRGGTGSLACPFARGGGQRGGVPPGGRGTDTDRGEDRPHAASRPTDLLPRLNAQKETGHVVDCDAEDR